MPAPRIGLLLGDPAGVGPEIAAKVLAHNARRDDVRFIVIGTEAVLKAGARVAEVDLELPTVRAGSPIPKDAPARLLMAIDDDGATDIPNGKASRAAGLYALRSLEAAVVAAKAGSIDAIVYAPLNKHAMSLAGFDAIDEMHFVQRLFGVKHFCTELNLLDDLWTVRATSHVPLREVADRLTPKLIVNATRLGVDTMRSAGVAKPRIAVAGLNPHAGDGGTIGSEDAEIILPAVEALRRDGFDARGPVSPDTVFVTARRGGYDLVVTMYHDQGQIALKSIGFERVVTLLGGLPLPAITASAGSAYDITGRNTASPDALIKACELAARMVSN
jgi:4-hydroxythreonine-4-phosphate dehydrogenase